MALNAPGQTREITVELCRALDSVSVAKPAAMRVLSVVDNPNANAQMLAGAIEVDPTFAAQIMRLANSAYYGMSGKVGNTGFAVSVIGFAAVTFQNETLSIGPGAAIQSNYGGNVNHKVTTDVR